MNELKMQLKNQTRQHQRDTEGLKNPMANLSEVDNKVVKLEEQIRVKRNEVLDDENLQ